MAAVRINTSFFLPLEQLAPADFERLCLWLVYREGYKDVNHIGYSGGDMGRDIVGVKDGISWAFQCKRIQNLSSLNALREVERILSLPVEERPGGVAFLVTCSISVVTRADLRELCDQAGLKLLLWDRTELDERVRRYPELISEFFLDSDAFGKTPHPRNVVELHHLADDRLTDFYLQLLHREGIRLLRIDTPGKEQKSAHYIGHGGEGTPWLFQWYVDDGAPESHLLELESILLQFHWFPKPSGVHFISTRPVSAPIRQRLLRLCSTSGMDCRVWGLTELDEIAKRHAGLLETFGLNVTTGPPQTDIPHLLKRCRNTSLSAYERGKSLETLAVKLFEACFEVDPNLRTETGEVDLWLERTVEGPTWDEYGAIAIGECKNHSPGNPVTAADIRILLQKCDDHGSRIAFFVSLGPLTEDALKTLRTQNGKYAEGRSLVVPVRECDIRCFIQLKSKTENWLRSMIRWTRQDRKGFYSPAYKGWHEL